MSEFARLHKKVPPQGKEVLDQPQITHEIPNHRGIHQLHLEPERLQDRRAENMLKGSHVTMRLWDIRIPQIWNIHVDIQKPVRLATFGPCL